MPTAYYTLDTSGASSANAIVSESNSLVISNQGNALFCIPRYAPFFVDSVTVSHRSVTGVITPFTRGIDWHPALEFFGASRACVAPIAGAISLINTALTGTILVNYHTLGGAYSLNTSEISQILSDILTNPRVTTWEQVAGLPSNFPPSPHPWEFQDMIGMAEILAGLANIETALLQKTSAERAIELIVTGPGLGVTNGMTFTSVRAPMALQLLGIRASVDSMSGSGNIVIDLIVNETSVLSSPIVIGQNWDTNVGYSSQPVISTPLIPDNARIQGTIVSSGMGADGVKLQLYWKPQGA